MESRRHERRADQSEEQWQASSKTYDAEAREPRPISRLSLVIAAIGVVLTIAASTYLYVAAKNAMAGPGLDLPDDQLYVKRCGSYHTAPAAEEFSKCGPRDWNRNVPRTMFMPGEQDQVHHYLERVGGRSDETPSGTRRPSLQ